MIRKENNYAFIDSQNLNLSIRELGWRDGTTKGNCDAELVLHAMIEYANYEQAVIVTGDGDFYCLVEHFIAKNKLKALLIPNMHKFSALLKFNLVQPFLRYMNDLEPKLTHKKEKAFAQILKTTSAQENVLATIKSSEDNFADFLESAREDVKILEKYFEKEKAKKIFGILSEKDEREKIVEKRFVLRSDSPSGVEALPKVLRLEHSVVMQYNCFIV